MNGNSYYIFALQIHPSVKNETASILNEKYSVPLVKPKADDNESVYGGGSGSKKD